MDPVEGSRSLRTKEDETVQRGVWEFTVGDSTGMRKGPQETITYNKQVT